MPTEEEYKEFVKKFRALISRQKQEKALDLAEELFAEGPNAVLNKITAFRSRIYNLKSKEDELTDDQEKTNENKIRNSLLDYFTNIKIPHPDQNPDVDSENIPTTPSVRPSGSMSDRELRKLLCRLYPDIDQVKTVVADVEPSILGLINWENGVDSAWREALHEAKNRSLTEVVLDIAKDDFKKSAKIIADLDRYIVTD